VTAVLPNSVYQVGENRSTGRGTLIQVLPIVALALFLHSVVAAAFNDFGGFQAVLSSLRILLSTVLMIMVHQYVRPLSIVRAIYYFGIANSVLAVLQFIDLFFNLDLLPAWIHYGQLLGVGEAAFIEVWRQGGIVPSLQTSSLLGLAGIIAGASIGSRLTYFLAFPFLWSAVIFGARALLVFSPAVLVYVLYRKQRLVLLWIPLIIVAAGQLDGFYEFAALRFGGLYQVLVSGSLSADYSASDTLSQYKGVSSVHDFLFGNACQRYSDCGGGDPLYSRWLVQAGVPALSLVTLLLIVLACIGLCHSLWLGAIVFVLMLHGLKGELVTSAVVYDALVLFLLALSRQSSVKVLRISS
jgi:hypothetical protein